MHDFECNVLTDPADSITYAESRSAAQMKAIIIVNPCESDSIIVYILLPAPIIPIFARNFSSVRGVQLTIASEMTVTRNLTTKIYNFTSS